MTSTQPHHHKDDLSKDNEAVVGLQDVPVDTGYTSGHMEIDEEYLASPKKVQFFRGVLWQMILFGALSVVSFRAKAP
jgi:hypothetical protein